MDCNSTKHACICTHGYTHILGKLDFERLKTHMHAHTNMHIFEQIDYGGLITHVCVRICTY